MPRVSLLVRFAYSLTYVERITTADERRRQCASEWAVHNREGTNTVKGNRGHPVVAKLTEEWWTKWHWDRFPPPPRVFRFSPVSFVLPVHHYLEKWKKLLIIFISIPITGLHNKPQGCGASVASAAGSLPPPPPKKNPEENYSHSMFSCI
jgi:hypothetical protein